MATKLSLSPQLIYQKALNAFQDDNYDMAESYLMYLVRQSPFISKNSAAFNILGLIYHHKNKFNQAIKFFKKSIEINPRNTEAIVNLSILLFDLGHYEDAREVFSTI